MQVLKQRLKQQEQQQQSGAAADKAKQQAKQQQQLQQQGARLTATKRRQLQARDELAELQHDYSMLRKLKKGKISEHAFDVATGLSSDSDMEDVQAQVDSEDDSLGGRDESLGRQAAAGLGQQQKGSSSGSKGAAGGVLLPPQRQAVTQEQQLRKRKQRRQKKRGAQPAGR